ncbi:JAB domain prokaryotic [Trinorchestia longiramus]|nr:JAB domain prokaryotic [Trinorchestia longiramus]
MLAEGDHDHSRVFLSLLVLGQTCTLAVFGSDLHLGRVWGNKFKGDLLGDGRIRSQETGKVFGTPSAWAIYCKQIVNPNKKSGCGWASVKYRGKKLDEYKNNWNRQKRLEYEREGDDMECGPEAEAEAEEAGSCSESEGGDHHDHEILEFDMLHTRHDPPYTGNPLVELTSFSSQGRLQPFTVAVSSSAMAVIDLHVHLTRAEALGFLAGQWDVNNHNLIVSHAFPLCVDVIPGDPTEAPQQTASPAGVAAEAAIHRQMASLKLALVGWYHSHPHSAPLPSLRDIDAQLDYEMKMKGTNDASYTPCVAFVVGVLFVLYTVFSIRCVIVVHG